MTDQLTFSSNPPVHLSLSRALTPAIRPNLEAGTSSHPCGELFRSDITLLKITTTEVLEAAQTKQPFPASDESLRASKQRRSREAEALQ